MATLFPSLLSQALAQTTESDDIISIAGSDIPGGVFDGQGGTDTLELLGGGEFDLMLAGGFRNFEIIKGSALADRIVLGSGQMAGIRAIDGVASTGPSSNSNFLELVGQSFDLRAIAISNINGIYLETGSDNATVVVGDYATAMKFRGLYTQNDHLIAQGVNLTATDIELLHRLGVDKITYGNGVTSIDSAPVLSGLQGDVVTAPIGGSILIDAGSNATVSDDSGPVAGLYFSAQSTHFTGSFSLQKSARVSFSLGQKGSVFVDGVIVGEFDMFFSQLSFSFNAEATSDRVSQIIRSVAYSTSSSASKTDIQITVTDAGSRFSRATVSVLSEGYVPTEGETPGEVLNGTKTADRLVGKKGDDKLSGKLANDILTGGAGKDIFVFDTKPGKKNVDKITDFRVVDDSIHLENSIFKTLGKKTGMLKKAAFWVGAKAHDASDRIVYDKKIGALYYDEDGSGRKAAVKFATINKVGLNEKDFFIV